MVDHSYEIILAAGVLILLLGFATLVFAGHRLGKPGSGWLAVAVMGVSTLLATVVLIRWLGLDDTARAALESGAYRFHWATIGSVPVEVGVKLDSLTVIMYFMVSFVSFWIFVFSVGYMAGPSDEVDGKSKYHRFFTFLCLFDFSMLGLVVASNLLFLFIFWELVGLCSYFLIGFYFDKKFASNAAIKAFVTNRVGDFGFLVGLMMVFFFLRTLDLDQAAATFAEQHRTQTGVFGTAVNFFGWEVSGLALATLMGIGLFCGAIGKSAQFPLQVWLPDAMAGPTPVSALIHAATMVAAGVYLVARIFRLLTPDAQMFIAVIGCITLTAMALVAIVQTDIKKVLAYSTLSQLGYMIFAMGIGAWIAALFHLMTHAFFKACLFLGSGQVIEGCHHEQDIRRMGGLYRKMPFTCWTFFVSVLAIAGAGIPGTALGIGGFFSKDEILAVAYDRTYAWNEPLEEHDGSTASSGGIALTGYAEPAQADESPGGASPTEGAQHGADAHAGAGTPGGSGVASIKAGIARLPRWLFWLPIIIAYVTPFYMARCWWLTFMGQPRDEEVFHHAHESRLMYVPLIVLSVGTLFASYFLFRPLIADAAEAATMAPLVVGLDGHAETAAEAAGAPIHLHQAHHWLMFGVGLAFAVGIGLAVFIYRRGLGTARSIVRAPIIRWVHFALVQKLFFDHVYDFLLVKGIIVVAWIARLVDTYIVDMAANLSALLTERLSAFSGWILDARLVDGLVNGSARVSMDLGDYVRRPQSGRIRHYVMFAAGGAAVLLLIALLGDDLLAWFRAAAVGPLLAEQANINGL